MGRWRRVALQSWEGLDCETVIPASAGIQKSCHSVRCWSTNPPGFRLSAESRLRRGRRFPLTLNSYVGGKQNPLRGFYAAAIFRRW